MEKELKTLITLVVMYLSILKGAAITYTPTSITRLGDNLIGYCHAKWVSHKYQLPLLYQPFAYSSDLLLSKIHELDSLDIDRFSKVIHLKSPGSILQIEKDKNYLYILPIFFPELGEKTWAAFDINWNDKLFLAQIKNEITPLQTLSLIKISPDIKSVAVHVRTGLGYDFPTFSIENGPPQSHFYLKERKLSPLRWPSLKYYVEQIQNIFTMLNNKPLYVHIFTDDPDPATIAKKIEQAIQNPSIKIGFRAANNYHSTNVLEDLFSMAKFDCLIRGDSTFSFIASKLGNFQFVIKPLTYHWDKETLVIDSVDIQRNS